MNFVGSGGGFLVLHGKPMRKTIPLSGAHSASAAIVSGMKKEEDLPLTRRQRVSGRLLGGYKSRLDSQQTRRSQKAADSIMSGVITLEGAMPEDMAFAVMPEGNVRPPNETNAGTRFVS